MAEVINRSRGVELSEKWIEGISPDQPANEVAALTLENRLTQVLHYLPLAARHADEDIEYVHHLRVWTRRASAALRLYKEWMPRRRFSWMKKQLKQVRRAANDARDSDILIDRLKEEPDSQEYRRWLKTLCADRHKAQHEITAVFDRLERGERLAKQLEKLLKRMRTRRKEDSATTPCRFGQWAPEKLRPVVTAFFDAVPDDPTDAAALHMFRIRGKELRYAMEVLAGAFSDEFRTRIYPAVESMQERLGEVNDLVTAKSKLLRKIDKAAKSKRKSWCQLLADKQTQLESAIPLFWQWCTPQMLEELRAHFDTLLADRIGSNKPADLAPVVNHPVRFVCTR